MIKVAGQTRIFESRRRRDTNDGKKSLPNPVAFSRVGRWENTWGRMGRAKIHEAQEAPNIGRTRRIYGRDVQETAIKILF